MGLSELDEEPSELLFLSKCTVHGTVVSRGEKGKCNFL